MVLVSEKYRPVDFSSVLGNSENIDILKGVLKHRDMPHMLFTGPPGTGKTTCAKILASKLLKNNKEYVLELNASDDRGIDVVRSTIKNFARQKSFDVPFKLIILDEADSMTTAAQQAMRRVMEIYSDDCRFILICNDFNKIFEPIQSRCAILPFSKISEDEILQRIKEIAEIENIKITENGLTTLVQLANGDMRQSFNILQSIKGLPFKADHETISEVVGLPSPFLVKKILKAIDEKDVEKALTFFDEMWDKKYDPVDIISSFFRECRKIDNYNYLKAIGRINIVITEGTATKLQFYRLFHDLIEIRSSS